MCRSSGRCVVDEWLWWWRSLLWLGSHFQNKQPVRKVKTYCQGAGFMGMGLWELAAGCGGWRQAGGSRTTGVKLTLSLQWWHLKKTNKSVKYETLQPFCFLFRTGFGEDFHQNALHWKEMLQDRKIDCFEVHPCIFQPRNFTSWGSEGVNDVTEVERWFPSLMVPVIFLEKTREGHRQSDNHWYRFKGNAGETSEKRGGAHYGLSRAHRYHLEPNWTELNHGPLDIIFIQWTGFRFQNTSL